MNNSRWILIVLLLIVILSGCGSSDGRFSQGDKTEYQDIMVEREDFPDFQEDFQKDGERHTLKYLGTQFLGEDPIQLWAERYAAEDGSGSIYKWGLDGKRELLAEGISDCFIKEHNWYLDREGCFYLINIMDETNLLRKLDAKGNELFKVDMSDAIAWRPQAICQTPDGKVYLTVSELDKGYQLAELDSDTGVVTVLEEIAVDPTAAFGGGIYLGAGVNGPAVCRDYDIREADVKTGEMTDIMHFNKTAYAISGSGSFDYYERIQDFRVLGEGHAEILKTNMHGNPAYIERLSLETIQRTPVVLCPPIATDWLRRQITRFNQINKDYHIVIEELGTSDRTREEVYQKDREDYVRQIGVRIATGKGPDILVGEEILGGNVWEMIEKEVLEDLRPYMENTGILEEDYVPLVFQAWRHGEKIYGICAEAGIEVQEGDKNIIKEDIRETIENMLSFSEPAVYIKGKNSQEILRLFLEGSETLWGMVDWEAGVCDVDEDFFGKLLEAARRYGEVSGNKYQSIASIAPYLDFYETTSPSELEERGLTLAGWRFDDGFHAVISYGDPIAINAGSSQKEGAWAFLCFLLGETAQEDAWFFPLRWDTFEKWADEQLKRISPLSRVSASKENRITGEWERIAIYGEENIPFLKEEKLPYFRKILEEARHLPIRSAPILDIVCEEAEQYFNESKSVEEVAGIIENRVNLYLNERR